MMLWIASNLPPLMFAVLVLFLLSGVPVAFGLAACGLTFALVGIELGLLPAALMQALPLRLFGIMANDTLLAIPFFTFMGLLLQKSGLAEDLLETVGQVFGPLRGGVALAVILVGALLAATTGVVAASVISMGLISLPVMLRYGYNRRIASGVIAASGSLAQVVPPSLVLIVMADQLGRSVGDMYVAALVPAGLLIGLQVLAVIAFALIFPRWLPALPPEARATREDSGATGNKSLTVLFVVACVLGWLTTQFYPQWLTHIGRTIHPPPDEMIIAGLAGGVLGAFLLSLADKLLKLNLLSNLARRVAFVMVPPLFLIFLVLGTIFMGLATPTEGGAMGAMGALALALGRGRISIAQIGQTLLSTTKLSCFVLFILIGSTVFSLTFQGVGGQAWVEHLFDKLPGGQTGFLIFVTALVFVLGFFLDFFEIAFILLPMLAPIADKLGIDLIWFGVLVGINLQTSFLTPPFGFALFYLRSVAPTKAYVDEATGKEIQPIKTSDIYLGVMPFVAIQVLVMGLIIAFPGMLLHDTGPAKTMDSQAIEQRMEDLGNAGLGENDPMMQLLEQMSRDEDAKK
jgi:TRAP-type mannitol/chloroaromatic compound transport system permease large subunit